MPSLGYRLSDAQIAAVVTYVRNSWGNAAAPVSAETVKTMRARVTGVGRLAALQDLHHARNHLTGPKEFVPCWILPLMPRAALSAAAEPAPVNDQPLLDAYSNAVIDVTERVGPAVVRVETGPKVRNARERGGLGSGIVISPDGLVLTNSHVVGAAKEIRLRDIEGFVTDAHVLGVDPDTDLALLRADGARELRYAALGNSKTPAPRPARGRDRQSARLRIRR